MITTVQLGASPSVAALQRNLRAMGMPVRQTGVLDKATVASVNAIFAGWDDAPPALASGRLTAHQIAMKLPAVSHYVALAAHGAMTVRAG